MSFIKKARARAAAMRRNRKNEELPKEFDARKKWSQCESISRIPVSFCMEKIGILRKLDKLGVYPEP
jgi:hypothetical protein